jgi:anti-sigma-K factor RskA
MSDESPFGHERLLELLADRALTGLAPEEEARMNALLEEYPGERPRAFEIAATGAQLALLRGKIEPMPAGLAAKVAAAARAEVSGAPSNVVPLAPARKRLDVVRLTGWIAAAACLVLAVTAWITRPPGTRVVAVANTVEQREALLGRPDARKIAWTATADPAAKGASGDVVFSVSEQRGYMRFHGLAANDRTKQQYQLWIFDEAQDERYPIDGGVFDVDASTGDVIVPIQAKIRVGSPKLFAVTIEKPGGVVVSKRERIVVTASS